MLGEDGSGAIPKEEASEVSLDISSYQHFDGFVVQVQ